MERNKMENLYTPVFANDIDAWIPEVWANESVAILVENMVASNLVHTDFKNEIANFGDVVNTRQPSAFTAKRKGNSDSITLQDAEATNIAVPLDQHFHVSFLLRDGEESKAFKSLVDEYLSPALIAIAQGIDKVILGQHVHFMANNAGGCTELSSTNAKDTIVDLRKVMNNNKAHEYGRNLIIGSGTEATMLKDDDFTSAEKVGDDGTALREASLGRKLGFDIFMCQNMSDFTNTDTNTQDTLDNAASAGDTSLYVTTGASYSVGDMILVEGDMTPQRVMTVTDTSVSGADVITISPGLRDAAALGAAIKIYDGLLIDSSGETVTTGYAANWYDTITYDNHAVDPQVGQQVIISPSASTVAATDKAYTIIAVDTDDDNFTLDRPLDEAILNNSIVSLYPTGAYNFAFHRNALTLVSRPLAQPKQGTGALSAVAEIGGFGVRVVITYDGTYQGHIVTVDILCGVKVLDTNLGAVLLG